MEKNVEEALKEKKIAPLPLDQRWHQLFQVIKPSRQIRSLEKRLDNLIKRQGKLGTESKAIKKIKSRLMDEIMQQMEALGDGNPDAACQKKLDDNKRLINECNEKLEAYQDELLDLPDRIDRVNRALILETIELCYFQMNENRKTIDEIEEWITAVRVEVKKKLLRKQERETRNQKVYRCLHGIFGPEMVDLFDAAYDYKQAEEVSPKSSDGAEKKE